jgi:hypothetical protein
MKLRSLSVLLSAYIAICTGATATKYFTSYSQDLWDGKPFGVVAYKDGTFRSGRSWGEAVTLSSTPISSVADNNVLYVGTTAPAELLAVKDGKIDKLCSFDEPVVTCIVTLQNKLYAGTGTPARIYEIGKDGSKKLVAQLEGEVVGCMIAGEAGTIIAGTSSPAKLFEVSPTGSVKQIALFPASYTRCMLKETGALYIGTSDPALLFKIDASDKLVLLDSFEEDEVAGLAPAKEGMLAMLNPKTEKAKDGALSRLAIYSESSGTATISKLGGPLVSIWGGNDGNYVASNDGRLYFYDRGKIGLAQKFDGKLSSICGQGSGPNLLFSAPPSFAAPLRSGASCYESPVINAGGLSRMGSLKADLTGQPKISVRSGNREKPDGSWSEWQAGPSFSGLIPSRYFQWKIEFTGPGDNLKGLAIALRPLNRAPVVEEAAVHPPNEIFIKNVSQLADRLVQDVHGKERPFPEIAVSRPFDAGTQTYYLYGFRMITFSASDPDGDEISTKIELTPFGSNAPVVLGDNIKENFFTFDARTLPDGVYRVVITASDAPGNAEGEAMSGEKILPYFEIDNTPPLIGVSEEKSQILRFKVSDNTSVLSARVSRDGKMWEVVESEGKVFAQKSEDFTVEVKPGDNWIVFQASDSYGNISTKAWVKQN